MRHCALVVAPQWIGDAVMSEPLLARLAAQGWHITVAALPGIAPVYRAMPPVSVVIELPFAHRRLDLRQRWRTGRRLKGRFDAAFVLPNSLKSALLPCFAGVPSRVGYVGEGRYLLLNQRLANPVGRPAMVGFYLALASADRLGIPATPAPAEGFPSPRLHLDESVRGRVMSSTATTPGDYFVFAPGADYGPAKRWPAGHYAALARDLHRRHGLPILLLGSAQEAALCDAVAADAPGACRVLAGRTALLDAMALVAGARGVVSNDSGLMHVAAAFGVPQAAVFGSTSPEHTPPLNGRAKVLWLKEELQLDCMPCFDRVCRYGHTRCLTGVLPERVGAALQSALDLPQPADELSIRASERQFADEHHRPGRQAGR